MAWNIPNKYNINGIVLEANRNFESLLGHTMHQRGVIQWYPFGAPQYATGDFRIN